MAQDVWFLRDGERRAVATNVTNEYDFMWAASLEIAVIAASLETPSEQQAEMQQWATLIQELAVRLRRRHHSCALIRSGLPTARV